MAAQPKFLWLTIHCTYVRVHGFQIQTPKYAHTRIEKTGVDQRSTMTEVRLMSAEFDDYQIGVDANISFCLKELRVHTHARTHARTHTHTHTHTHITVPT